MIRLFDQNIWCNKVIANRNSLICKMIARYDADIITLQECRPSTHRVGDNDIGAMLAGKYAEATPEIFDQNHTPIFYRRTRFDLLDSGYELLEGLNNINSKSITWAVLYDKVDRLSIAAVSTHFWYKAEDEADLSLVGLDMERVCAFARGFVGEVAHSLTENERKTLEFLRGS